MSAIGTGSTTSTDAKAAAAELVERAKAGLEGTPKLAILFATSVAVMYGFEQAGLERVVGIAKPENAASVAVLSKLGMRSLGAWRDAAGPSPAPG